MEWEVKEVLIERRIQRERERNTPRANESSFRKCDDPGFPFDRMYETEIEFKRITLPV